MLETAEGWFPPRARSPTQQPFVEVMSDGERDTHLRSVLAGLSPKREAVRTGAPAAKAARRPGGVRSGPPRVLGVPQAPRSIRGPRGEVAGERLAGVPPPGRCALAWNVART